MADSVTFIGDVHGWIDRLEGVLAQAEGDLVFLGDLIDRGPDSRMVVERVRELCESGRARCILGNHEYAMVRGLGVPDLGIPAAPQLFEAWWQRYGGDAAMASWGAPPGDASTLRMALGSNLTWLAGLPWYLEGEHGGRRWLAVHSGLASDASTADQLAACHAPSAWAGGDLPAILYSKERRSSRPPDLDPAISLVSGHTPVEEVRVVTGRILADTSGGRPGRPLSAVVFPEGRVIRARSPG